MPAHSPETQRYHLQQYLKPYESTGALIDFIRKATERTKLEGRVLDVGCGAGANIFWLQHSGMTKECRVTGVDSDAELITIARSNNRGASFVEQDFCDTLPECDTALSIQVLSFIEDWRPALRELIKAARSWVFVSSLFWDGVSTHTHASDGDKVDAHYNVIRRQDFEEECSKWGGKVGWWHAYYPWVALYGSPKILRSRTDRNMTLSGPLLLPWTFVAVSKK